MPTETSVEGLKRKCWRFKIKSALPLVNGHRSSRTTCLKSACHEETYAPQETESLFDHLGCSTATVLLMPRIISSVMIEPSSMTKFDVARLEPARLRLAVRPTV